MRHNAEFAESAETAEDRYGDGGAMKWDQARVERFFGGKFNLTENPGMRKLRFSAGGLNYLLLMMTKRSEDVTSICLATDTRKHFVLHPSLRPPSIADELTLQR